MFVLLMLNWFWSISGKKNFDRTPYRKYVLSLKHLTHVEALGIKRVVVVYTKSLFMGFGMNLSKLGI